ncbi:unnamed protein product [Somion occarium]|uniref:Lytic polysaccharide monooxygenase 9 n=1 Tax=Somion occarium TaxID=3059160 RepID=A0ABP1EA18_9APHY
MVHGHLDYPPHDGDFFELPAGGTAMSQLSCDKGATSWYASSPGGDAGYGGDYPCPGQPLSQFHTTGIEDVTGCGLGIAYKSDARSVQPEDFAIFSVNHTCVWYLNTAFQVPSDMPACPEGGCTCAWFWIHSPDSGAEQIYMTGFKCEVTGAHATKPIGKPAVARRCGADAANGVNQATPSNCTVGPKQPLYWYQKERNNMFEGTYSPPVYNDLYGFADGAQNDIFQAATVNGVSVFGDDPAAGGAPPTNPPAPSPPASSAAPAASSPAQSSAPAPTVETPAPVPPTSSPPADSTPSSSPATPTPSPDTGNHEVVQTSALPASETPSSPDASSQTPATSTTPTPEVTTTGAAPTPEVTTTSTAPTPEVTTVSTTPIPEVTTSASAPASTKKCTKKGNKKKRAAKEAELNARHDAIRRHVKRRLPDGF